jgi:pimeloyl-ACP methyl ester carboxylesterase
MRYVSLSRLALLCLPMMQTIASAAPREHFVLEELGSFYVRGRSVALEGLPARASLGAKSGSEAARVDPNGEYETHQVYVQYAKLARPRHRTPFVLWHGGSLTGATYESTPDGRAGWQTLFLRAGRSVYIVDTFQTGRAPWARYPEINPDEPLFRTKAFLWETFRIGPAGSYRRRETFSGTRFPSEVFDQLAMQAVPRFVLAADPVLDALTRSLERIGPSVIVAHSASGPIAFRVALSRPDLVKALIAVEPSGGIDIGEDDAEVLRGIPHLFIWGDNLVTESWRSLHQSARRYADELQTGKGRAVTWIDLPARGVRGNSHLLMMDDNSAEVADLIAGWARKHAPD